MWHCNFKHNFSRFKICLAYYANTPKRYAEDFYKILNVKPTANQEEIRKAFLEKSKMLHPDASIRDGKDTHKEFVNLNKAYSVLSKPELRKDYDIQLRQTGNRSSHDIPVNNQYLYKEHFSRGPHISYHDLNDAVKIPNKKKTLYYLIAALLCLCFIPALPMFFSSTNSSDLHQNNKDYSNWLHKKFDDNQIEPNKQEKNHTQSFKP